MTKDGRSLTCPTCRHIVPLSERGVAGLQSDFHIDHLFEIQDAFNKAEDDNDTNCGSCEDGKATGYCNDCNDCGDFLCEECQTAHKRLKYTRNHYLISLNALKAQMTGLVPPQKATPNCPKHSKNDLKIYCDTCSTLICMDCTIRLHKDHNYDLVADVLTKHKEELVSSLKPVKEKLDSVQRALKDFDTRAKAIHDQRTTIEANIHKEIGEQHRLLDQRRAELVGELEMLTQQKLKDLAAQRDQVEITQVKLTSCLEYAEGGLKTGTDGEILKMKFSVVKRVEQITTEFESKTIQPETKADMELTTKGKEPLQQACRDFLEIEQRGSFSLENSHTTGDGLKGATIGEIKTVSFQLMTKKNKKFNGKSNLKAELVYIVSKDILKCEVIDQQHGQHKINYRPMKRGKHELHITVNGNAVRGSPFPIAVAPSPQSFIKPSRVVRGVNKPRGTVSNSKGELVVVEGGGATISVLTPEGEKIRTFGKLNNAYGVTVDKDDNIYVMEVNNHRVNKFSSDGEFVAAGGSLGSGNLQFSGPLGICYNRRDNNLYVPDQSNNRIQVLSTELNFVRCFGTPGKGNGQLQSPLYAAFDSANNLYVTEYTNHRVQVFTAEGQFLRTFSQKANGHQKLSSPYAIAIDSSDTVYVSENGLYHVNVFTSQGAYITTFGGPGTKEGQFNNIYGLSIDRNDSVVVSDEGNERLQIF